jgi:hypothetical protein
MRGSVCLKRCSTLIRDTTGLGGTDSVLSCYCSDINNGRIIIDRFAQRQNLARKLHGDSQYIFRYNYIFTKGMSILSLVLSVSAQDTTPY